LMPTHKSKFEIWKSTANNQWYWRFKAGNGEKIASGEGYAHKEDCVHAVNLLKNSSECEIVEVAP
jgi:uncharacterized protein YegP (UPF0339 family)